MRTFTALMIAALIAAPALAQRPGGGMGMFGGRGNLLTNKSVQDELKLTDEQKEKIKAFGEKMQKDFPQLDRSAPQEERMQRGMKMTEAQTTFAKETLSADQAKRYKEIQLQVGGILGAVMNPETATALKITDEQKDKLKEIGQSLQKDMQEMFQGGGFDRTKMQALTKEASAKALEALTSEQKKSWEEMSGKPFEIKMEQGGPGGGKGGGKRPPTKPNPDKKEDK